MRERIYLDYNATTPLAAEVAEAMEPFLHDAYGNPSSLHWAGVPARDAVEDARSHLPCEVRRELDDWFRCIGGALVQDDFLTCLQRNGLDHPRVLWLGRNARTGHELARCAVIRAEKQP